MSIISVDWHVERIINKNGAKKANDYKFDISHLNLHYGDFHALKDVNMKIEANKITAFIGPSGCGKSTFLRCINRLEEIDTGVLKLNGVSYEKEKKEYKQSQREDRNGFPEL